VRTACLLLLGTSVLTALAEDPVLVRGPYLQKANSTALTVHWRTDLPGAGLVRYGTAPGSLTQSANEASATDHSVRLTGLTPATKYYYAVESSGHPLASGPDFFFTTPPPTGSTPPVRIWVLGDAGTQQDAQRHVRDAFYRLHAERPADVWLMLGDNAYPVGSDEEYQGAVFDMYQPILRQVPLWSCIGNHETYAPIAVGSFAYDNIFDFPVAGECGGVASGTERYYSWDHANIHFISLDSQTSSRHSTAPMARWLEADLAANLLPWTIVCFHHPPYTKGTHDSDDEIELAEMRTQILPILEAHGVDLVLGGHSHVYERSYLLRGHYGLSTTFHAGHRIDGGNGREDGDGAYTRTLGQPAFSNGTVYVVAGSGGQSGGGELNHPAHFISLNETGSLVIDISGNRLDARFLREAPDPLEPLVFDDRFTLLKVPPPPPLPPTGLTALPLDASRVALHWDDAATTEDAYELELSQNGGFFQSVATLPADATGYLVTGLPTGIDGIFRVRATNLGGPSNFAYHAWHQSTPASPVPPIQAWRFVHWGTTAATGERADGADPDGDTRPNLLEYALGTSPRHAVHPPGYSATQGPGGRLEFHFQRVAATDLTYTVEFSSSLQSATWQTAFTSSGAMNTAETVTVPDPAEVPGPRRFARLKVVLGP
jgi:acid phosphatase type 7